VARVPDPTDTGTDDIEVRCAPGRPCGEYVELTAAAIRARRHDNDAEAQRLFRDARDHRHAALHGEPDNPAGPS
jgi:hypothetical protein